jgi:hypothetical protein
MKLALENPTLVSKLIPVDISPVTYNSFSVFADYIKYMRMVDLNTIKTRTEADEFLKPLIPVTVFFSKN